ncbi:MAG: penicillin-binding transpeptidase domain-containing protein [Verrucomicrobiota bacterium]
MPPLPLLLGGALLGAFVAVLHADESMESATDRSAAPLPFSPITPTWESQKDARVFTQLIPAPRGRIVDRKGRPMAQTKVAHYLQLQLPTATGHSEAEILRFAHGEFKKATDKLGVRWELPSDEVVLQHHRNRRWVPLTFSPVLSDKVATRVRQWKVENEVVTLLPIYLRHYPKKETASHILGHIGRRTRLHDTSPLVNDVPIWPRTEGRDGLEVTFDEFLQGETGQTYSLFAPDGEKLIKKRLSNPVAGNDVVTTIDLDFQQTAERALRSYTRAGAFVVMDVRSGDILAMASHPTFDPNDFTPFIATDDFARLRNDPLLPLYGRAFRGLYPPASTFKAVVALAALEHGIVDRRTTYSCPGRYEIDGRYFHNHSRRNSGPMNLGYALARSCNTWFYQAGLDMGPTAMTNMAEMFGVGERTGIPVRAEPAGFMPSEDRLRARYKHSFGGGYLANAAIGQGHVLMTPLQVAQMMAGLGNGQFLPRPRLVQHVQANDGRILRHFPSECRRALDLNPINLQIVTDGLVDVVSGPGGTGRSGGIGYAQVAGKTGTGQWGDPKKKQYVAWFAGFVPAHDPVYAFAALYEGAPGHYVSGGKNAAPMTSYFFRQIFRHHHEAYLLELGEEDPTLLAASADDKSDPPLVDGFVTRRAIPVYAE